jgi:NAD(P) transhydrogenase subunit beta
MAGQGAQLFYLAAAVLFILGLRDLTHPRTAPRGNLLGALAMLVAVVTVLASEVQLDWVPIAAALLAGGAIGTLLAYKIRMTAMPQLVALFNAFGGGASLLVAVVAVSHLQGGLSPGFQALLAAAASALIGAITWWGSLMAFAKLQGVVRRPLVCPGLQWLNGALLLAALACAAGVVFSPAAGVWMALLSICASLLGVLLVAPIGGADMPVVIAALNAYSGLAASATGFVLNNALLIVAGSLVGASGIILTRVMCRAMNRSFTNVILGKPMARGSGPAQAQIYDGKIKATSAEETAMLLEAARRVVIVPGFGMAVSQAQFAVRDLYQTLERRGITVEFAIHPVAGRMPGHMNVLLAEADIPYDKLKELEVINPTFDQADVALVVGANDVVNPDARQNAASPIAGMPILDVDKARTVVVIKRSLSPGFAGIPNPLFGADNTLMLFEDGKAGVTSITQALKA